jgi:hypothetical protein
MLMYFACVFMMLIFVCMYIDDSRMYFGIERRLKDMRNSVVSVAFCMFRQWTVNHKVCFKCWIRFILMGIGDE